VQPGQEQHAEAEPGGEQRPGGGVPVSAAQAQHPEQQTDCQRAEQRSSGGVEADEQPPGGAGETELGDAVHREGTAPGDHERAEESGQDSDQCPGDEGDLDEVGREQRAEHQLPAVAG